MKLTDERGGCMMLHSELEGCSCIKQFLSSNVEDKSVDTWWNVGRILIYARNEIVRVVCMFI